MDTTEISRIALAMKFKNEGLSFRAIAEKFNSESVPTPSGRGKWGHEMIKRLIANEVLTKAEVKVGLVSESEVRLKEEVESLKAELYRLKSENERLESENVSVCSRVDILQSELDRIRQENEILKSDHDKEIDYLRRDVDDLISQRELFKTRAETLNRVLAETELKFHNQYESEIKRLGSELAVANQTIQELRDKQSFISVDDSPRGKLGVPKNHAGWTTQVNGLGYIRLFKKFSGKNHCIYYGKNWNPDVADKKIAEYEDKKIALLKFAIRKDVDEQLPVPLSVSFEDSLRRCCPEQRMTYRLDKVRQRFPSLSKLEFDRNMLSLAAEYKIELVGGDPRECDMDTLIRDTEMNITYVNFEWRS